MGEMGKWTSGWRDGGKREEHTKKTIMKVGESVREKKTRGLMGGWKKEEEAGGNEDKEMELNDADRRGQSGCGGRGRGVKCA